MINKHTPEILEWLMDSTRLLRRKLTNAQPDIEMDNDLMGDIHSDLERITFYLNDRYYEVTGKYLERARVNAETTSW